MAAPTPVVRQAPNGLRLEDGMHAYLAFGRYPDLAVFEIGVGSPGIDGGEPVDLGTQWEVEWRPFAPRKLKTLTSFEVKYAYDPIVYNTFTNMVNVRDTLTETYPDGSSLTFYGYLQRITKDQMVDGTMPGGSMTVMPTNYDPVNHVVAGPVLVNLTGT